MPVRLQRSHLFTLSGKAFLVLLFPLLLAACVSPESWEAVRVLKDIDAGEAPSALKETTPTPTRREISYSVVQPENGRPGPLQTADLYHPNRADPDDLDGALVLVPGFTPSGKNDRRLVALARSFARTGFLVLVPDLLGSRETRVRLGDARRIADAMVHLSSRPEIEALNGEGTVPQVGVVAISYAVGLAVLATTEADAKDRTGFLVGLGGYYDTTEIVRFTTTGAYRVPGERRWRSAQPLRPAKWYFLSGNIEALTDPDDRATLTAIADIRQRSGRAALLDGQGRDLVAQLGPEGRDLYSLMTNEDPAQVAPLLAGLPESLRRQLDALSLKNRELSHLTGRLILIHGREDPLVPFSESIALSDAVPETELFLIDGFSHINPRSVGVIGQLQLADAIQAILARRKSK
ncbi:alpha/beta fold hydrolase [Denitrobaculum tricleocarpae]|uniref:Alpha/beta hydrolase n=1 Tax=Denitrobaculum tricleocarpae TaxID=2591009 RepID=A0A545TKX7_9PROT|nr:alpha/beta hydrolase [Denitrobaculum tricleocarpae]TQV77846.1 alpha/beta hydrolase [Denitrobaculum tricleocarpae]